MRNTTHTLTLLFLSVLSIISCKKDTETPPAINDSDGYISYSSQCSKNVDSTGKIYEQVLYDGTANFFTSLSSRTTVDIGTLSIGNIHVVTDAGRWGTYSYYFTPANSNDSNNAKQFGAMNTFSISGGGGYATSSTDLYVPQNIFLDTTAYYPTISLSKLPYRIRWNADPSNQNNVNITLEYNGVINHDANPSLPDTTFINNTKSGDVGYYDITAQDLANIRVGSLIDLTASRINTGKMISNGKSISVTAESRTSRSYTIVP